MMSNFAHLQPLTLPYIGMHARYTDLWFTICVQFHTLAASDPALHWNAQYTDLWFTIYDICQTYTISTLALQALWCHKPLS